MMDIKKILIKLEKKIAPLPFFIRNQLYFSRIKSEILKANLEDSSHFYFFFLQNFLRIMKKKLILLKRKEISSHDFCLSIFKVYF